MFVEEETSVKLEKLHRVLKTFERRKVSAPFKKKKKRFVLKSCMSHNYIQSDSKVLEQQLFKSCFRCTLKAFGFEVKSLISGWNEFGSLQEPLVWRFTEKCIRVNHFIKTMQDNDLELNKGLYRGGEKVEGF